MSVVDVLRVKRREMLVDKQNPGVIAADVHQPAEMPCVEVKTPAFPEVTLKWLPTASNAQKVAKPNKKIDLLMKRVKR
jgi:hypothetical protein